MKKQSKPKLTIRNAILEDIPQIITLTQKAYPDLPPYQEDMIRGHILNFSEGQFVVIFEEKIIGYCATFRIKGDIALKPHNWKEITGGGYASRHAMNGDYLYGMEVCVHPEYRGLRIGQRLYNERKKLCQHLRLKGIVFGGRIPGFKKRKKKYDTVEKYIKAVEQKKIRDNVLSFQLKNGFEILGVLPHYLPADKDSEGNAVHLIWHNPQENQVVQNLEKTQRGRLPNTVRVATIQYRQRKVKSFDEFASYVEYFVDVVADYKADFVVFPELFTLQLLSIPHKKLTPAESIQSLTQYAEPFKKFMQDLAIRYNINIIGGSHPLQKEKGPILNVTYVFLRDGSIHEQPKIHPTPNERYWWNIEGGDECNAIMTDCGPIGVMICYDSEFPELARHLVDQGAQILFVPFCTDERQSYLRVRYCCQARAVENQCFVVMSGNVGNLPGVENMDIQYAQSCILTPCDFVFARDGIAADTTPNVEMVGVADLRPENIRMSRNDGTVQNLKDRRFDLYSVNWNK